MVYPLEMVSIWLVYGQYMDNLWIIYGQSTVWIWLVVEPYPSEKYEFVSWDDEIPTIYGKIKNVPNHQPALELEVS